MNFILITENELRKLLSEVILQCQDHTQESISSDGDLIDKKEAAQLLKVSLATVDNYRRNGILPSYRIGATIRFKRSEILEVVSSKNASYGTV